MGNLTNELVMKQGISSLRLSSESRSDEVNNIQFNKRNNSPKR